jgi:hypothetical protein
MPSLAADIDFDVRATAVQVTHEAISVELDDGRTIVVPTSWYPRLKHATAKERSNYECDEFGVHWPDIDADFSIRGLLLGRKSGESPKSFKFWLDARKRGKSVSLADFVKSRRKRKK